MGVDLGGDLVERRRSEDVIVVEERHEFPCGETQGGVGRLADVAVLRAVDHPDARVLRRKSVKHGANVGLGRRVVGDAQLPVGIELVDDRLYRL